MNITILNKYNVKFRFIHKYDLCKDDEWLGEIMINDIEVEFGFSSHVVALDDKKQPDWNTIRSFLEFFFEHIDSIFKTSREIIIAFLKVFGMYETFISYDKEEMTLVCIELLDTKNNTFSIRYHIESDRYFSYVVEFYQLSYLLVLKGVKRE